MVRSSKLEWLCYQFPSEPMDALGASLSSFCMALMPSHLLIMQITGSTPRRRTGSHTHQQRYHALCYHVQTNFGDQLIRIYTTGTHTKQCATPTTYFDQHLGLVISTAVSSHIIRAHNKNKTKKPILCLVDKECACEGKPDEPVLCQGCSVSPPPGPQLVSPMVTTTSPLHPHLKL